jgi:hypothetical protein
VSDSKHFKGKRVVGSGNQWAKPGDVLTDDLLIEVKQTDKKSYSLNRDKIDKIEAEALFSYRIPIMSIKIRDKEVVVMLKDDWLSLVKNKFVLNKK